jgi:hypothetical protein
MTTVPAPNTSAAINADLKVFAAFNRSKYLSVKLDSYFQVYEEVFRKYAGQQITFVEVGVLSGGSLFMWREFFGPEARIIGIDLNLNAKKWEKEGFEIYIGDQSDPSFWEGFFQKVGLIDVLLDDGGHTNRQQIITVHKAISHIKDGGTLIVEDAHASYIKEFGNPSKYSFINFAKHLVDSINSRFPRANVMNDDYGKRVYSIHFYESMVVFNIDSKRCFTSQVVENNGITDNAPDWRHKGSSRGAVLDLKNSLSKRMGFLKRHPLIKRAGSGIMSVLGVALAKIENRRLKSFFS